MLHLWKNDSGIQDVRDWLLNDLVEIESSLIEEGNAGDAATRLGEVISRLCSLTDSDQRVPGLSKASGIQDNEPVVVLRATDPHTPGTLARYVQLMHASGAEPEKVLPILRWIETINQFAIANKTGSPKTTTAELAEAR